MPNRENAPEPPESGEIPSEQAPPSAEAEAKSKREQAEGVMMRLNAHVRQFKDAYLASIILGQIASSGLDLVKAAYEEQEKARAAAKEPARPEAEEPSLEVRLDAEALAALDPEASPERVRFILDTLPKGFVEGEVESIGFTDEKFEIHESYGPELQASEGAGTAAGGTRTERTVITFWKGMKAGSSEQIWNGTLLHEVAHANDWDNDQEMGVMERMGLKGKVALRVQSEDRYRSAYVEAISNPDPVKEMDVKVKEYWAEIVEAYLKGEVLPGADEALVKEFIAGQDPDFDRDAALAKRKGALDQMAYEEMMKEYEKVPEAERSAALAWVEDHMNAVGLEELDAAQQRLGRRELVKAMRAFGTTDERRGLVETQMNYLHAREELLDARKNPQDVGRTRMALNNMGVFADRLARTREIADDEDVKALDELAAIAEAHDLVIGEYRGAKMELGEIAELFPGSPASDENEWMYMAVGWQTSDMEYDIYGPEMMLRDFEAAEEEDEE